MIMTMRKRKIILSRRDRLLKDLTKVFQSNPNNLFSMRDVKKLFVEHSESELYNGISQLVKDNIINLTILHHKKYYWFRRRVRGF